MPPNTWTALSWSGWQVGVLGWVTTGILTRPQRCCPESHLCYDRRIHNMRTEVCSVAPGAYVLRCHTLTWALWGLVQQDAATTHKPLGQILCPGGTSVFMVGAFCRRQKVGRGWASFRRRQGPHDSWPVLGHMQALGKTVRALSWMTVIFRPWKHSFESAQAGIP